LQKALIEIRPEAAVEVVDALAHCARWFRLYYNSYEIPLKYWPSLWGFIEGIQHQSPSTGPAWLYRKGAQPLFQFIQSFDPDIVVATEVGTCELAAMLKRQNKARFYLVGLELMDFNQAWVQPEVDLYPTAPGDLAEELEAAGVPPAKILPCGYPVDPSFVSLPEQGTARRQLGLEGDIPLLLVLFGGTGFGKPRQIVAELRKVPQPLQTVFIAGRNQRLEREIREAGGDMPRCRVRGWVDNMQEWMAAADLLLSKPGGGTVVEAMTCGLPMLAFDPLPGNERRTCDWIEKWQIGYWVRRPADIAPTVMRLLENRDDLQRLRKNALALARPRAAYEAAEAIFKLLQHRS
jgi:processive 1,2-diacylglycerol beta-glucosyltransferase